MENFASNLSEDITVPWGIFADAEPMARKRLLNRVLKNKTFKISFALKYGSIIMICRLRLARTYVYSINPEKTDTIQSVSKYWYNYNFKGFGEMISSTQDLFKYDQALYDGRLLSESVLKDVFTTVKLNNGEANPVGNGLGWQIEQDSSIGKLVMHSGAMIGVSSILLRNITKHQTIIIIDNT